MTEYFLEKHVKFYGTVTQKEAYRLQGSANTLVMLAWSDKKQQFIYPTKLFEYMACEAPILVTGGNRDDNVRKIVSKTSSGFTAKTMTTFKPHLLIYIMIGRRIISFLKRMFSVITWRILLNRTKVSFWISYDRPFESQFHLTKADYENTVNFVNWIRYFYIFKEVINSDDAAVMEVGSGNGIVKNLIYDRVKSYKCMDINESLSPDYLMDVCIHNPKLSKKNLILSSLLKF